MPANPAQPHISCLALDIGGVICADTWQTIFENGLIAQYNLDPAEVTKLGQEIWDRHAYAGSNERAYWTSWQRELDIVFDRELIARIKKEHVWADRSAAALISECHSRNIKVCFVSNSTSFWYPEQMRAAGITDEMLARMPSQYLSHQTGYSKTHIKGGLTLLAGDHDPRKILFVDDRKENIEKAAELGMHTLFYARQPGITLEEVVVPKLFGVEAVRTAADNSKSAQTRQPS